MFITNTPDLSINELRQIDAVEQSVVVKNDYGSKNPRVHANTTWAGIDVLMPYAPELSHDLSLMVEHYFSLVQVRGKVYWKPIIKMVSDGKTQYHVGDDKHVSVGEAVGFIYTTAHRLEGLSPESAYGEIDYEVTIYNQWLLGRELVLKTYLGDRGISSLRDEITASILVDKKSISETLDVAIQTVKDNVSKHKEALVLKVQFESNPVEIIDKETYQDDVSAMRYLSKKISNGGHGGRHLFLGYGAYNYNDQTHTLAVELVTEHSRPFDEIMGFETAEFGEKLTENTARIAAENGLVMDMKDGLETLKSAMEANSFIRMMDALQLGLFYTIVNSIPDIKVLSVEHKNK